MTNCFKNMSVNDKECILCNNIFTVAYYYNNNDVLCLKCANNYNEFMFEDNNDNVKII